MALTGPRIGEDAAWTSNALIATALLALAAGATLAEAATLANRAAGIAIGKLGTATVSPDELKRAAAGP